MDKAQVRLQKEEVNSSSPWDAFSKDFLKKYFPSSETTKLMAGITSFA